MRGGWRLLGVRVFYLRSGGGRFYSSPVGGDIVYTLCSKAKALDFFVSCLFSSFQGVLSFTKVFLALLWKILYFVMCDAKNPTPSERGPLGPRSLAQAKNFLPWSAVKRSFPKTVCLPPKKSSYSSNESKTNLTAISFTH